MFFLAVEHVHGISRAWLERGEGEMMAARPGTTEVKFYGAADAAVKARRLEPGAYFLLPLVSGEVAAGPGAAVHEREIEDYIPSIYQRDWCPHPAETICVRVVGTSMESTIHDGGIVAVDRAQRDPRRLVGKVVALRRDGGVTVKRLTTAEGGLWIARPDNPQSPETLVFRDDEIVDAVVGKVVWSWSRMS